MKKLVVAFVVVVVIAFSTFMHWAGWQFCLGAGFAVVVYQLGHYAAHGRWIEF